MERHQGGVTLVAIGNLYLQMCKLGMQLHNKTILWIANSRLSIWRRINEVSI